VPILGFWDLLIIAFLVLLIFGPKRLPQMGRGLGGMFRGFKDSVTGRIEKLDAEAEAEEEQRKQASQAQQPQALPQAPSQPVAPPARPAHDPRERDTVL
jgi:sec-independent protein translocase protein TatA